MLFSIMNKYLPNICHLLHIVDCVLKAVNPKISSPKHEHGKYASHKIEFTPNKLKVNFIFVQLVYQQFWYHQNFLTQILLSVKVV